MAWLVVKPWFYIVIADSKPQRKFNKRVNKRVEIKTLANTNIYKNVQLFVSFLYTLLTV